MTIEQNENVEVSKQELQIYDRQIRLWGMEAQTKLRNSKVLVIGGSQLGAEVAKTLSLAGVDEMHLVDHRLVQNTEIGANFLYDASADNTRLTRWVAAQNFLTNLNRNVKLFIVEDDLLSKSDDEIESYVRDFTIVIVLDETYDRTAKLNAICHKHQIRFVAGAIYGWVGYAFFDFDGHSFLTKVEDPSTQGMTILDDDRKESSTTVVTVEDEQFEQKTYSYPTFAAAFSSDFSTKKAMRKAKRVIPTSYFLVKTMLRASRNNTLTGDIEKDIEALTPIWKEEVLDGNHTIEMQPVQPDKFDHLYPPEFSPTSACIGGIIGQEAIKTITEGKLPIRNIFIYSALDSTGIACDFPMT